MDIQELLKDLYDNVKRNTRDPDYKLPPQCRDCRITSLLRSIVGDSDVGITSGYLSSGDIYVGLYGWDIYFSSVAYLAFKVENSRNNTVLVYVIDIPQDKRTCSLKIFSEVDSVKCDLVELIRDNWSTHSQRYPLSLYHRPTYRSLVKVLKRVKRLKLKP